MYSPHDSGLPQTDRRKWLSGVPASTRPARVLFLSGSPMYLPLPVRCKVNSSRYREKLTARSRFRPGATGKPPGTPPPEPREIHSGPDSSLRWWRAMVLTLRPSALVLPKGLPSCFRQPGKASPSPDRLHNKTQTQAERCFFRQMFPAGRPVCCTPAIHRFATSFPASRRKARVHRAARSILCVTRIEVRP